MTVASTDPLAAVAALPGVADAVAEARAAVDRVRGHRVLRRRRPEVSAESALRGARASAALAGADWPLDDVRRLDRLADRPGRDVVAGAVRATALVGTLVAAWQRAPLQALARLHVLAARDLAAAPDLGRPAPGAETAARLDALARLVVAPSAAPALVVAAAVHGELLALRPFPAGTGLVARAAERLVLVSTGLDPAALSVPEVGHAAHPHRYAAAAEGYATGGADGVAAWVAHCAWAVTLGAQEALAVCTGIERG